GARVRAAAIRRATRGDARVARPSRIRAVRRSHEPVIRTASAADARAIHALIAAHLSEGHLLPRTLDDIEAHATRFLVATVRNRIVACADLAPLSPYVAEVRSLVVGSGVRSTGLGQRLVNELANRARIAGFESLCAFTHVAGYFVRMGFSIVPHPWVPEKIETDCRTCPLFRRCGQYAVTLPLARTAQSFVPLASL